ALRRIEQAEEFLFGLGLRQVRVRHHDTVARIEVEAEEMGRLVERAADVVKHLKSLGYQYVTMDLQGYRTGSMNEALVARVSAKPGAQTQK
ncbi:MAG: TIGR00268 family protein, partial [Chloroflexota bacterium]|nr:TIGR00268 family protein [Chloroflexota bacterium]